MKAAVRAWMPGPTHTWQSPPLTRRCCWRPCGDCCDPGARVRPCPTSGQAAMSRSPIRVLLVDDSPVALAVLKRMLATSRDIRVAGTAGNGREALELIPRLQPDVICVNL